MIMWNGQLVNKIQGVCCVCDAVLVDKDPTHRHPGHPASVFAVDGTVRPVRDVQVRVRTPEEMRIIENKIIAILIGAP